MKLRFWAPGDAYGTALAKELESRWETFHMEKTVKYGQTWLNLAFASGLREGAEYTFNPPEGIANTLDPERRREIFLLNRVPEAVPEEESLRRVEALVLDQQLLYLRLVPSKGRARAVRAQLYPQAAELARRAAYVLGADFAKIRLSMNRGHRYGVETVSLYPVLREKDWQALIRYLEGLKHTLPNTGGSVMLGADPEFMLANARSGRMMPASDFFPRSGRVGCDDVRLRGLLKHPVAEIRPTPDVSPIKLTENIRLALEEARMLAPYHSIRWLAGSLPFRGFSTGGHVHFSRVAFNGHLLRALDVYVGLPLYLVEAPERAAIRRKRYGLLGDYRLKSYGGFEYRTPASWLVGPEWTRAALCLCKVVADSYPVLENDLLLMPEMQRAFYEGKREALRAVVLERVYPALRRLRAFENYRRPLEWLFEQIRQRKIWEEKKDFRGQWGLR